MKKSVITISTMCLFALNVFPQNYNWPDKYPIAMSFRAGENDTALSLYGPYDIIHASPMLAIEEVWPEKLTIGHDPFAIVKPHQHIGQDGQLDIFPGHLLFHKGETLNTDIPSDEDTSFFYVSSPDIYAQLIAGTGWKTAVLYAINDQGSPDWGHYEYVTIFGVVGDSVIVKRGCINNFFLSKSGFNADNVVLAPIMNYPQSTLFWRLNYSLYCPLDSNGMSAAIWHANYLAPFIIDNNLDGIELDMATWYLASNILPVDCDNDLVGDNCYINGRSVFGLGACHFAEEMRELLGEDRILQFDSGEPKNGFRCFEHINGIELENFPSGNNYEKFSECFIHLQQFTDNAQYEPTFSYPFTKTATYVFGGEYFEGRKADFRFRVGLASATIMGLPHTYAAMPSNAASDTNSFGLFYWDEYFGGDMDNWKWLGAPSSGPVQCFDHLGTTNILDGMSPAEMIVTNFDAIIEDSSGYKNIEITQIPDILINNHQLGVNLKFPVPDDLDTCEYTIQFDAKCRTTSGYLGNVYNNIPSLILIRFMNTRHYILLDGSLKTYRLTIVPNDTVDKNLIFGFADEVSNRVTIGNFKLFKGGCDLWQRDFENGKVIMNMTKQDWTISLPPNLYRKLSGTQAPEINTGDTIVSELIIPAWDALFIAKNDTTARCYDIKAFLEGPFNGGEMNTLLNFSGALPLNQPFNSPPWDYDGPESVGAMPNDSIVDWVLTEFRQIPRDSVALSGSNVVFRKALFVLNSGKIVDMDGYSLPPYTSTISTNIYVVVWHRNHLGVMSSTPIDATGGNFVYDFTDDISKAFGNGQKEIGPGIFGMIAGDCDGSRIVDPLDKTDNWNLGAGRQGYLLPDLNLDGEVDNVDKNDIWEANIGKKSKVPD